MLDPGKPILDLATGESRFRLIKLLARGKNYDVALGEDIHLDNKEVCLKAIRYEHPEDPKEVKARRAVLEHEMEALTLPSHLLPEPLDWLTIENHRDFSPNNPFANTEPVLVYEKQSGETLRDKMSSFHKGLGAKRSLTFANELAYILHTLHQEGKLFRNLNPDHMIIGIDDILHVIGCSNITPLKTLPLGPWRERDCAFVAPEARTTDRAEFFQPQADVYSLGALLSYMLTGVEPLKPPEAPLSSAAYEIMQAHEPGLRLLVAKMMHPNPKKRFQDMAAVLPHLHVPVAPNPEHPDFKGHQLPAPSQQDQQRTEPKQRKFGAGPLVIRTSVAPEMELEPSPQRQKAPQKSKPKSKAKKAHRAAPELTSEAGSELSPETQTEQEHKSQEKKAPKKKTKKAPKQQGSEKTKDSTTPAEAKEPADNSTRTIIMIGALTLVVIIMLIIAKIMGALG